jgi:small GTP-binding protein
MEEPSDLTTGTSVVTDDRFKMPSTYVDPYKVGKEYLHKICIVGDLGTGKSALSKRLCQKTFSIAYKSTIGVDFGLEVVKADGDIYRMQYWDIAGQERFGNMTKVYYVAADAFFVMIDASRLGTEEGAIKWKKDVDAKFNLPEFTTPMNPVILLVNKMDLIAEQDKPELKLKYDTFCTEHGFNSWLPISVKDDIGVTFARDMMVTICKNIVSREPKVEAKVTVPTPVKPSDNSNQVKPTPTPKPEQKLTSDMFSKEILLIFKAKYGNDNSHLVALLRDMLLGLYFAPELESTRKDIKTDEKLKKLISGIHDILTDETTTDSTKAIRILNFIMDYGKPF